MHELSIANSIVEIVGEQVGELADERVDVIRLRLGALSCVHKDALEFSFELITNETPLEGAKLAFIDVPVSVFCEPCNEVVEIEGIQKFRCPRCGTPSSDIRGGQELEIEQLELTARRTARAAT